MPQVRPLIVEPEAEEDIAEGMAWYAEQQPGLGAALLTEVDEALQGIQRGVHSGVRVPHVRTTLPVRRVLLGRFPYAVVFLEHADRVHVIAVAHFKRRPGYWASRLRDFHGGAR